METAIKTLSIGFSGNVKNINLSSHLPIDLSDFTSIGSVSVATTIIPLFVCVIDSNTKPSLLPLVSVATLNIPLHWHQW